MLGSVFATFETKTQPCTDIPCRVGLDGYYAFAQHREPSPVFLALCYEIISIAPTPVVPSTTYPTEVVSVLPRYKLIKYFVKPSISLY